MENGLNFWGFTDHRLDPGFIVFLSLVKFDCDMRPVHYRGVMSGLGQTCFKLLKLGIGRGMHSLGGSIIYNIEFNSNWYMVYHIQLINLYILLMYWKTNIGQHELFQHELTQI